jgi:UDPglucose 6-dehydrogenase
MQRQKNKMSNNNSVKIAYVGLTHLGLISAAAALEKGFKVIAIDPDNEAIARLAEGDYPINEPGFAEVLEKYSGHIAFSSSLASVKEADVVYVSPDIATDDNGISDLSVINNLLELVLKNISPDSVLVVLSQIPPGFMRNFLHDVEGSGLDVSNVYYQVETLVFGIAMQRALYPERYILGCAQPDKELPRKLNNYLQAFGCPILPMRYESAEFCKICINAFLAASVSTTNCLEEICQKIGARWNEIAPALKLDKRIGQHAYLAPGLGISGGNIERDLRTIVSFGNRLGSDVSVVRSFVWNSNYRKKWPVQIFYRNILPRLEILPKDLKIAVLGLAYKENTHSIKNSPAVLMLRQLNGFVRVAYDPVVRSLPKDLSDVKIVANLDEVFNQADVLFIMTAWDEFKSLSINYVREKMRQKFVVDPFGILKTADDLDGYYSFC